MIPEDYPVIGDTDQAYRFSDGLLGWTRRLVQHCVISTESYCASSLDTKLNSKRRMQDSGTHRSRCRYAVILYLELLLQRLKYRMKCLVLNYTVLNYLNPATIAYVHCTVPPKYRCHNHSPPHQCLCEGGSKHWGSCLSRAGRYPRVPGK